MSIVRKIAGKAKSVLADQSAQRKLKRLRAQKGDPARKVRIVFLVQLPEIWDKQADVYEALKQRSDTEVTMLVVPPYDFTLKKLTDDYTDNFFLRKYGKDAVRALKESGEWVDLRALKPDYVFFPRPYDDYLPTDYRSDHAVDYTKCCYIPYGYSGSDAFNAGNTNRKFFRSMYCVFPESDYMLQIFNKLFGKTAQAGLQHFYSVGYPSLEPFLKIKPSQEIRTVLWTPRWSYAPKIGGSHFLEYKDLFLALSRQYPDRKFIFRPHPLMFQELIHDHRMTEQETEEYIRQLSEHGIIYDKDSMFLDTAKQADLFITDYSSIMIDIFLTGKPVIYCPSYIELNADYKRLQKGMYLAQNEQELSDTVGRLFSGEDPNSTVREELVKSISADHENSAARIAQIILEDYQKQGD